MNYFIDRIKDLISINQLYDRNQSEMLRTMTLFDYICFPIGFYLIRKRLKRQK